MLGVVASIQLIAYVGATALTIAGALLMIAVPAAALAATAWRWEGAHKVLGMLCLISSGAAVLVAISCPPLSHVRGMQTGGMLVVATAMLVIPVLRGEYRTRGMAEVRLLGTMSRGRDDRPGTSRDDRER